MSKSGSGGLKPVPFHHLFSFRVSVQYTGAIFDGGGDRIVQVDVDHHCINILQREQVKKSIAISEVKSLYTPKRQAMQLIIVERVTKLQNTLWFMNQGELNLFHAVVEDLKDGKHPGNRIRVPLIRQATIMKRNRAGFFNIRHATLMPGKMVLARNKGNSPPDDVVALREAALGLDEKKGLVTIGVAGRTSVWKGLSAEDTFKWHDALLSALSGPSPVPKTQAQKRSGKPPRLSMIYGDELSSDRVFKARDSMFMDLSSIVGDDDDFEPPDVNETESPLPDAIMLKQQAISVQKEAAEDLMPSPSSQQSDSAPPALRGMVKAAIGQMRENLKKNKERERALSTVTQMPDDIAWRDTKDLDSDEIVSDLSDEPAVSQHQRHSAEEAPTQAKVSRKGHQRTGSAPPTVPIGSITKNRQSDLQGIPEGAPMSHNGSEAGSPHTVRFPDQGDRVAGETSLLTTMLDSPTSSLASTPRQDSSVILHAPEENALIGSTGSTGNSVGAQPVLRLSLPAKSKRSAPSVGTAARPKQSQSTGADTVEFPSTPERPMQPAYMPNTRPSPDSFYSPVAQPEGGGWPQSYTPVQWPDVQDVRLLNHQTTAEHIHLPSCDSMSPQPIPQSCRVGVSLNPQQVHGHASWSVPPPDDVDTMWRHNLTGDDTGGLSQRDSMLLDGAFLPGAPRVIPAQSSANVPVTAPMQVTAGAEAADPDSTVLRSLGKAWLHRSKLRGMVRQLKGSLTNGPAQCVSAPDIVAKLISIDQMLDEMPEMQDYAGPATAPGPTPVSEISQPHVGNQQLTSIASERLPSSGLHQTVSAFGAAPTSPTNQHSSTLLTQPTQERLSRSHSPQLDAIASQMDTHSAELLHHVSVAMAQLPPAPTTAAAARASQAQQPQNVNGSGSSLAQSHGYIHNPLFVNTAANSHPDRVQESPASFSALISRIRLTECRLQEAITSLTDATHRFKEEMPHDTGNDASHRVLSQPDAMEPKHEADVSSSHPLHQIGDNASPGKIASPLRSLEWTQLNPLYPASSRSMSPESQLPAHPASPTPSPMRLASSGPEFSGSQHMQSFLAVTPELGGQIRAGQRNFADQPSRSEMVLPFGHGGHPGASVSWPAVQNATDLTARQSAVDSMVSMSSAWSLEHPVQGDRNIMNHPASDVRVGMAANMHPHRLRALYSASSDGSRNAEKASTQGRCTARPVAASAGHIGPESQKCVDEHEYFDPLQESASLPGWTSETPADVDAETRTATDNICRVARSITQTATDLESYVLKRFPLSPEVEFTEWVERKMQSGGLNPATVLKASDDGQSMSHRVGHPTTALDACMPADHSIPTRTRTKAKSLAAAPARRSMAPTMCSKAMSVFPAAVPSTPPLLAWNTPTDEGFTSQEGAHVEADRRLISSSPQPPGQPKSMAHLLYALERRELSQEDFLSELCELRVDSINPAASDITVEAGRPPFTTANQA